MVNEIVADIAGPVERQELAVAAGFFEGGKVFPAVSDRVKMVTLAMKRCSPAFFTGIFSWDTYRLADACVAGTSWEAFLMADMFGASPEKIHVVPNGIEEVFLNSRPVARGAWLV